MQREYRARRSTPQQGNPGRGFESLYLHFIYSEMGKLELSQRNTFLLEPKIFNCGRF